MAEENLSTQPKLVFNTYMSEASLFLTLLLQEDLNNSDLYKTHLMHSIRDELDRGEEFQKGCDYYEDIVGSQVRFSDNTFVNDGKPAVNHFLGQLSIHGLGKQRGVYLGPKSNSDDDAAARLPADSSHQAPSDQPPDSPQ